MNWRPTTDPVVITCALTGGIHGKEANENLPEQPDEIVAQGVAAAEAGAAILHVHARNPDGSNTMDPEIYGELHDRLRAETDAIVQLTTGGSPRLSPEERINTVRLAPEMCSLNMGLLNFFIAGEQVFFANHRSDIERFAEEIRERDVKPELEIYSAAMLEETAHLLGLNVRVGMEDNVFFRRDEPLRDNAQLVDRAVRIANELDRRPATPDEARALLGTCGRTASAVQ